MNTKDWIKNRSTAELLNLKALLETRPEMDKFGQETSRWHNRVYQVNAELEVRVKRQLNFLDRLDGKDVPDD